MGQIGEISEQKDKTDQGNVDRTVCNARNP